jgi:outer membrane biosynthesis protein TonB
MRPVSSTAAVVIAGLLALLLIAYVFVGGSSGRADAAPHCTSQQALAQVKAELFRRAAAIRGANDPGFQALETSSVVRAGSALVRRHHRTSSKVSCSGSLVLDLPPGAAVVGGRHSLSANLAYDLQGQSGGAPRLLNLSNAENIVVPLATVGTAAAQPPVSTGPAPQPNQPVAHATPPATPPPPMQVARPTPPPRPPVQAARPTRVPPPHTAPPPPPKKAAPRPASPPAAKPAAPPPAPPSQPVAVAKPSFNCRYARTRGEVAVCSDPGLASLDRQMSAEYFRAIAAARPGQRAMLERSRNRFLRFRDSCGSQACIADAYRGRIREIADIMSGDW